MFDFSFGEIALIGIVALVVIGPERLPRVARTAGVLFGRMQRYVNTVKHDIAREIELDELKKLHGDMSDAAKSMQQTFTQHVTEAQAAVTSVAAEVNSTVASLGTGGMFAAAAGASTPSAASETVVAPAPQPALQSDAAPPGSPAAVAYAPTTGESVAEPSDSDAQIELDLSANAPPPGPRHS